MALGSSPGSFESVSKFSDTYLDLACHCHAQPEIIEHVLWHYPNANQIWPLSWVFLQRPLWTSLRAWEAWLALVNLKPAVTQLVLLTTSAHLLWSYGTSKMIVFIWTCATSIIVDKLHTKYSDAHVSMEGSFVYIRHRWNFMYVLLSFALSKTKK